MVESMIRLFPADARVFTTNGIGTLPDATSCLVTEERNGEFELEITYPINGKRYSEIERHRIIVAKSNPFSNPQPFRIYNISKPINGIVTINAEHISYDTRGYIVSPLVVNTANVAFRQIKESCVPSSCPFTFFTDVETYAPLSLSKPTSIRSVLLGSDVSAVNSFGGEFEFDVYSIKLLQNRGSNRGYTIRYGKNMTDFRQEENCSEVFTGVYPFWYSEQDGLMDLSEKTVYADGNYDFVRIYPLDLSEEFSEKPSEEALREEARKWMKENDIGVPKVSFTVSFVQLANSEEYSNFALLEEVRLCDTVSVEFPDYNVSTTSKCIKTVYDVLTDKYYSIEMGDTKSDIASTIAIQKQTLDVQKQTLAVDTPTKSFMQEAIEHATKMITGGLGGYVIFNSSTGGEYPDEILIMDTDNINTAKNVWRWNKGGLGHSSNGYNGPFETAITMDGWIVGKRIAANSISAEQLTQEYKESVTTEISNAASDLKTEMNKEFDDVSKSIDEINTELETTVADGIITESEKAAINKMLQFLQKEKEEADATYNEIIQNGSVPSDEKSNLTSKYTELYGASAGSTYNALISSIQSVLNSDRNNLDQRMDAYRKNYQTYSTKASEFRLTLNAVAESMANQYAREYADKIKEQVDKELSDVEKTIGDLNTSLEEVASDGVITESEKAAISKMLQIVEKEKEEADEQYDKLYSNENLIDRTSLANAYTAVYGSSSTQAYNRLVSSINKVLESKSKQEIDSNMETYRTDYEDYSTKLAALKLAIANATEQIANAYAKSVSETTVETSLTAANGKIRAFVSETVTAATTVEIDGESQTVKEAIKSQQAAINLNKEQIDLRVSKAQFGTEFDSHITTWWNSIEIESSKINLTAIENKIDNKLSKNDFNSTAESWAKSSAALKSQIQIAVDGIKIEAPEIKLEGYVTANNTFSIDTSGSIKATGGTIGGFTITYNSIYRGENKVESTRSGNVYLGENGIGIGGSFKVTNDGALTSTSGSIAGWNITNYCLYKNSSSFGTRGGIYIGTSGISLSDTFKVGASGSLTSTSGSIGGWTIGSSYLKSPNGNIQLNSSGSITIGNATLSSTSNAFTIKSGLHIYSNSSGLTDGSSSFKVFNIPTVTSGGHLVFNTDGSTVSYLSSSSKRYKDHVRNMDLDEAKELLKIPVVWFKYKDGYLVENDWMCGSDLPGLYAEDVSDVIPEAAQYNEDGFPEDWNYRVIIPLMLKLIQHLYEKEGIS